MAQKNKPYAENPGVLFLVSTPIGNLEDITARALRILREVDLVLAEDTRRSGRLLSHYGIQNRLLSYYSYNEKKRIPGVIEALKSGKNVALITDAGTPGISDPAHRLVTAVIKESIEVSPIPGPSAAIAALVASGLPTQRFVFEGFLPRKKGRQKKLNFLKEEPGTIILYESPYRVQKTLEDIVKIFGNRYIVISRELTKSFEEFIRGNAEDVLLRLKDKTVKGEVVLLIAGTEFKTFD